MCYREDSSMVTGLKMIRKIMVWSFSTVTLLATVTFLFAYLSMPQVGDLKPLLAKAQQYDVEILRDTLGIPHVYGKKDVDTAFGLGYVQSEDDFETLQTVVLATRGSLAAKAGPKASQSDFLVQFMGVWETVDNAYQTQVPEKIKRIAQAYADGVNTFAAQHPKKVSPYLLPVTDKDVIAGFTFKSPMFYGFDKVLGELLNPEIALEFADTKTTLNTTSANITIPSSKQTPSASQLFPDLPIGSQGIAISPMRSADGLSHLLINSHQPLSGPVAWYEARLHSEEGWNMVGSTFPGAPLIIHGHNNHLGWANTVNKPDLVDVYRLVINPQNEDEYLLDGQWLAFEKRTAKILVKLFGPIRWTFEKEIKISKHGPILETERGLFALRWAGMREIRNLEAMFALNKASKQSEFENVLRMNALPSINFVYADKDGNIAHYYNAKFPDRIEGWEWEKILPGDRSELIWQSYREFDAMPKTVNPSSGMVYNANNPPWHSTDGYGAPRLTQFPASMGIETVMTNRALQIEALLSPYEKISHEILKATKYNLSYHPDSYQIKALNAWIKQQDEQNYTDIEQSALAQLTQWDLSTDKHNTTAALAIMTLAPVQKARGKPVAPALISQAFIGAVAKLQLHYGDTKVAAGDVFRLMHGEKNLPISGGPDILRAVYGQEMDDNGQIKNIAGDGFMMLVSWDKNGLVNSQAIHQYGSATKDKNSPHYNDQMEMFVAHQERTVLFTKDKLETKVSKRYRPVERIKL